MKTILTAIALFICGIAFAQDTVRVERKIYKAGYGKRYLLQYDSTHKRYFYMRTKFTKFYL